MSSESVKQVSNLIMENVGQEKVVIKSNSNYWAFTQKNGTYLTYPNDQRPLPNITLVSPPTPRRHSVIWDENQTKPTDECNSNKNEKKGTFVISTFVGISLCNTFQSKTYGGTDVL